MKIVEELQDIDRRLVEWLTKEGLTGEQREALVEARKELVGVASRMLLAKILDPEDYKKLSESSMREVAKTLTK
jgi:DNA-binding TFAR19-related protein (PDSD5 family)